MPQPALYLSKTGVALAVALGVCITPALGQTQSAAPAQRTLSIEGTAELHVAPDTALVAAGVVAEADTAAAALTANSAALAKAIEAIRGFGIESKDLQTAGLSLTPRYYRPDKPTPNDRPRIIGYTASNEVTARVHDLGKLGDLLDKITLAGINRIDGISFVVSNQDRLLDEARQNAVADAKRKADLYATSGGFALGRIMTLTEESAPTIRPVMLRAAAPMAAPPPVAVPVEAGEATLSVRVHVVWSLAD